MVFVRPIITGAAATHLRPNTSWRLPASCTPPKTSNSTKNASLRAHASRSRHSSLPSQRESHGTFMGQRESHGTFMAGLNEMIVGTIARAKRRYGVRVCGIVVMSNHLHLFLEVDNAKQLADFQCMVLSKIAREVARKTGWAEKVWGRRYTSIEIHESPEAQIERFHYLLSHGVKENLVARCTDWPGVHCAESLITGRPLVGYWFDRTAEYNVSPRPGPSFAGSPDLAGWPPKKGGRDG